MKTVLKIVTKISVGLGVLGLVGFIPLLLVYLAYTVYGPIGIYGSVILAFAAYFVGNNVTA